MQGRLSTPVEGRIQAFPWESWQEEFERAQALGLELIEWVLEAERFEENPLWTRAGRINDLQEETGVAVRTVCADCFMSWPLTTTDASIRRSRVFVLEQIIRRCSDMKITTVTLPFVDESAIRTAGEWERALRAIQEVLPVAAHYGVFLALETSLSPRDWVHLLSELDHPSVKVNYDTGNSASLGFRVDQELSSYGAYIATVHIKDRTLGGGTVPLGRGAVDFPRFFSFLAGLNYSGPLILQGARGDDDVATVQNYLSFLRPFLSDFRLNNGEHGSQAHR